MLHLKLIISLSFSFLLFIDCFISAKMRILSFILSRKGRFSALERAFSGTLKGVVPKKFLGASPQTPNFCSLRLLVHPIFWRLAPPLTLNNILLYNFRLFLISFYYYYTFYGLQYIVQQLELLDVHLALLFWVFN